MYNSSMVVNGVDWKEMGKYLVVLCGDEGLEVCDLQDVLPRRAKGHRHLGITYIDKDVDTNMEKKWNWSRDLERCPPSGEQKKRMISMTLNTMTNFIMSNHIYRLGGMFYQHKEGGPIGLLITTILAEITMRKRDRIFLQMMRSRGIAITMYKRWMWMTVMWVTLKRQGILQGRIRKMLLGLERMPTPSFSTSKWKKTLAPTIRMGRFPSWTSRFG